MSYVGVCMWRGGDGGRRSALSSTIARLSVSDETSFLESSLNYVYYRGKNRVFCDNTQTYEYT